MTAIGVSTYRHDNPKDVYVPSYSYQIPSRRRVQLVSVKEGIFHPRLPTIRQLDRDRVLQKLPDEHCRSSVPMSATMMTDPSKTEFTDFKRAATVDPASLRQRNSNGYDEGGKDIRYQYSPTELRKTREEWSNFLNRCPERFNIRLTEHPDTADTPYTGYAMRYLKPDVTARWRFTLKQEPGINQHGQKPTPANIQSRYRDIYSRSAASVSTDPYRPPYANHRYHM